MTDIQFAKEHMGEYFQYRGYKVRVIGYEATDTGASVIIDYPAGWYLMFADISDVINKDLLEAGRCYYVDWEELK